MRPAVAPAPTEATTRRGPLVAAGLVLGAGMGGFVDGIVFHQVLQWHEMISGVRRPDDLVSAKANMFWDGIFHVAMWLLTAAGVKLLWDAGRRADVPWSGRTFVGAWLAGWGLFDVVEGTVDHLVIGVHHVREYDADHLPADVAFLVSGAVLIAIGWWVARGAAEG